MIDWSTPRAALLRWYDANARDLPWRRTRDPYAIWVSEVMLQQTRVDTVIPYYERFMTRFPTVQTLADAPRDDVLAHWSGLGYYRRARLLHEGARTLLRQHGGAMPHDAGQRRALPSVGRYTAGAIGSIAFDLPEPIVDGNVARVLTRWLGITTPLGARDTEKQLWEAATKLVHGARPGALNQALMELGARVCTKAAPNCAECPLAQGCKARRSGQVASLPVPARKKAAKSVALVALVARSPDAKVWLVRSEGELFAGLWGVPLREGSSRAHAEQLAAEHKLRGDFTEQPARQIRHLLTHRRLLVSAFVLENAHGTASDQRRPYSSAELGRVGVATLTHKILAKAAVGKP